MRRLRLGVAWLAALAAFGGDMRPADAALEPPALEITYSIHSKGAFSSSVAEFAAGADAILNDPRGWSLGGSIRFRQVASGGSFRLWLVANALVPSFGGPCTTYYSCQPGTDIVINEDRWRLGSKYWPGPVALYRHMVVNHEVGHWLGFRHTTCPGPEQPAPIAMQQSKGLNGCVANPWPTPGERARLAATRRVPLRPAVAPPPTPRGGIASTGTGNGYWVLTEDGRVGAHGDAVAAGGPAGVPLAGRVVDIAGSGNGTGYWIAAEDGGVFAFGGAPFHGSAAPLRLAAPVVGMAALCRGTGYWLAAADGGVFAFGAAPFRGSAARLRLAAPVVGMAALPDGSGYWLAAADGGVFAFGAAPFHGSAAPFGLAAPVVGMAALPDGSGYWLAAADGGVFAFGAARFHGSAASLRLAAPVVGMAALPDGSGYWLAAADGGVFAFGAAHFLGAG